MKRFACGGFRPCLFLLILALAGAQPQARFHWVEHAPWPANTLAGAAAPSEPAAAPSDSAATPSDPVGHEAGDTRCRLFEHANAIGPPIGTDADKAEVKPIGEERQGLTAATPDTTRTYSRVAARAPPANNRAPRV